MITPTVVGSIVQTATLGNPAGDVAVYNDLDALRRMENLPLSLVVNPDRPITKIVVRSGWLVNDITVTYNLASGREYVIGHGGAGGAPHEIVIGPNDVISSVSGLIGPHRDYANKVFLNQISFTVLNADTGVSTVHSCGERPQGNAFVVTLPALFTGSVGVANANTTGICALGVIKRGEF